jgi:hypothetical protein
MNALCWMAENDIIIWDITDKTPADDSARESRNYS